MKTTFLVGATSHRRAVWLSKLIRSFGAVCLFWAASLHAAENLVENGNFEAGKWTGGAYQGKGRMSVVEPEAAGEARCLQVVGLSPDARVQAISKQIPVEPGRKYRLNFQYRLSEGKAAVQVRWAGTGYVFPITTEMPEWTRFEDAVADKRIKGVKFLNGLGNKEGRQPANSPLLSFPEDVSEIQIVFIIQGEGVFSVSQIELILEETAAKASSHSPDSSVLDAIQSEEAKRLLVAEDLVKKAAPSPGRGRKLTLEIHDPESTPAAPADASGYPKRATNLRIEGDQFTRDGKPVFLFGLEAVVVHPWFYRLLGMDVIHMQDTSMNGLMRANRQGDRITVSWARPDWSEVQIRSLLNAGLAPYVQVYEENRSGPLGNAFPELYGTASHFVQFRFDNPEGKRLRQDMWRTALNVTKNYPVFAYELFNEAHYMDYSPANLEKFRKAMEEKYGTIGRANLAWGTSFGSFAGVTPPEKGSAYGGIESGIQPKGFSRQLWVEWQKTIESAFASHVADLSRFIHSEAPGGYCTIQSTANVPQDYSGGAGVYPPAMMKSVDFFADECGGGIYIAQDAEESKEIVSSMMKAQMGSALMAYLSRGKPVMDVEIPVGGRGIGRPPETPEWIALSGLWKFKEDNERTGERLGYEKPGFDDVAWGSITAPGLWGNQGHPDCTFGWYRKTVEVPLGLQGKKIFLNGDRLSDTASLYVNGTRVHETKRWNETFGLDISPLLHFGKRNSIVVSIANRHRDAGMYWGGIRGYLTLDGRSYNTAEPLRPGQMRSFFWQKVVNGKSGAIISYAYVPEGSGGSLFNPKSVSLEAIRSIPLIRQEIGNVGEIVLRDHRKPKAVALNFSFESGRARVYDSGDRWLSAPANTDLADYYMALLFGGEPPDVVNNEAILEGRCDGCRAIVLRSSERVLPGVVEKLEAFARKGGVVIVDHGSLSTDDDTGLAIDLRKLAGVRVGEALTGTQTVTGFGFETPVATVARKADGHTGQKVALESASALAAFADGSPALTRNGVGKGAVYYLAAELPYPRLQEALLRIFEQNGIQNREIVLERAPSQKGGRFVEARLFHEGGTSLAYVHNWGAPASETLKFPLLPEGRYRVRQLRLGQEAAERLLTARELRDGIAIDIPSQDPQIFLIEDAAAPLRLLPGIDAAHERMLSLLRQSPKSPFRVLINASHGEIITKLTMPTAVHLLEENGFQVETGLGPLSDELTVGNGSEITQEMLRDYRVLATLGSGIGLRTFAKPELEALKDYVSKGGGLLIAANQVVGPNRWLANRGAREALAAVFGVKTTETNLADEKHANGGEPTHPILEAVGGHPITEGVKTVFSQGMSGVDPAGSGATVLLRASQEAEPPGAAAMVALKYGKGRVVVVGDPKWLEPDLLAKGDNARLFLNLINWLAQKDEKEPPSLQKIHEYVECHF